MLCPAMPCPAMALSPFPSFLVALSSPLPLAVATTTRVCPWPPALSPVLPFPYINTAPTSTITILVITSSPTHPLLPLAATIPFHSINIVFRSNRLALLTAAL
mmetsp:Transcript_45815/g.74755  ORF Transcript_45815/g.74755 Transcript_45815/m.74755 type:complete len:103 (+) Transcript_45815:537-845(+)